MFIYFSVSGFSCSVRKLFRQPFINTDELVFMTKLNNKRIRWLVNQIINKGKKPKELAKIYGITERRVQQLARAFKETKKYPELNKNRRPKTFLSDKQKQAIDSNYLKTKYTPRILYYELQRQDIPVPKNKI